MRNLVLILGDQLDRGSSVFDDFDRDQDKVLMVEAVQESTHVWSHKARTALFLSAMRHFAEELREKNMVVLYRAMGTEDDETLADGLSATIRDEKPKKIILVEPGDRRVEALLTQTCKENKCPLEVLEDTHFLTTKGDFRKWAGKSKTLRMEYFYRDVRRKTGVLMDGDQPAGGKWNYDAENRKSFGKSGPKNVPEQREFAHDKITKEVLSLVESKFAEHPGTTANFNWPVTRAQALDALDDFIAHRLPRFGPHQDAMWTTMPFGWHALLSSSLNLKLIAPREVIAKAEAAYNAGDINLASAEGFIRQILGWREFIRGVYFLDGDSLKKANHYEHQNKLPSWYWTGETQMNCMKHVVDQTLQHGYAHHIQRLMITGMFGVTAEILPQELCDWYLAVYVDAVEWVELPNTAGMALFANGGRFTSKPYVASGAYVKRMSNYCDGCTYKPDVKSGDDACPVTTLYWNFLDKHLDDFQNNPRTALMVNNLLRLSDDQRADIRAEATRMLNNLDAL